MTTENRTQHFSALVSEARIHGEILSESGLSPQMVSVAVNEYLLQRNSRLHIKRNTTSPYDLIAEEDGQKYIVFLDTECHKLVLSVMKYLVGNSQEEEVNVG